MRVLFLSTYFPSDLTTFVHGVHKRLELFVDAIKEMAQLDMLFYVPPGVDVSQAAVSGHQERLSKHWNTDIKLTLCRRVQHYRQPSSWRSRWLRYGAPTLTFVRQGVNGFTSGPEQVRAFETCLRRGPDMIFAHRLPAMCPAVLTKEPLPPIFFDLDDIEHIVFLRHTRSQPKLLTRLGSLLPLPALCWGERKAIKLAARSFVCSESDRRYLETFWRLRRISTIPNAVRIPRLQPIAAEPTLLFLGTYLYRPNVEAADFLIEKVFPRVYREMPGARLILAGIAPDRIRGYHRKVPGVEFTGFVEDLDQLYRRARVVCAPLFSGVSGTQTKLIEAAAYGKPIVANRLGANGVEMRNGRELLVCDDPESFAGACLQLLNDPGRCQEFGSAARARAIQFHDRTNIIRLIQEYMKNGNHFGISQESSFQRNYTERA